MLENLQLFFRDVLHPRPLAVLVGTNANRKSGLPRRRQLDRLVAQVLFLS